MANPELIAKGRGFGWIAMLVFVGMSGGCATGKCLEYAEQTYQSEVCDRTSDTGWCSARHWETRSRSVCVKREEPSK